MAVRVERTRDVAIVIAEGRFVGGKETDELDVVLTKLVVEEGQAKTLLNLVRTKFMSSRALGVLIKTQRAASTRQAHFALCGAHPRLKSVIVRCFGSLLQVIDDCDVARNTLERL
jgi:anti-anti-sigma factor